MTDEVRGVCEWIIDITGPKGYERLSGRVFLDRWWGGGLQVGNARGLGWIS